jgi:hypothetical protein
MTIDLAALLLLASPAAPAQDAAPWTELEGTRPAQWRVIFGTDPATQATISWSTAEEGTDHRVSLYSSTGEVAADEPAITIECQRNGRYTPQGADESSAWYHHARVDGLEPSSTYHFVLSSDDVSSPEFFFTTAPQDDRPFQLIYGGDSRSGLEARQEVNRMMAKLLEESPQIVAFAHGGDYIYDGRRWPMWSTWLSHHELTTTAAGRVLPIIPVRGNHDIGPLFDEVFDAPGGSGHNYYTTRIGSQVALVTLNSEISTAGDQAVWLEEELETLRPSKRWLLAQYHRPAYPAVKTPGSCKASWVPLFERFDVDLVLESDGHVVKRTVPIRDEKHDPTGVTYIGEGGLGVPQRVPDAERWYLQPPGMTARGHHVTVLEFSPQQLRMRTVGPPLSLEEFEPHGQKKLIEDDAEWRYMAGTDPAQDWRADNFDDAAWSSGRAGFGYGDEDDTTQLDGMRGNYERVYIRHVLPASVLTDCVDLALQIRYDDGFIAYFEGHEVCRAAIASGSGTNAQGIENHEARARFEYFTIPGWRDLVQGEEVVLAIEGHNDRASSSDFTLHPRLIADPGNIADLNTNGRRLIDDHSLRPRTAGDADR